MKVTTDACVFGSWVPVPSGDVLDIGTGTGLLSLMIVQRSECIIDAVELDEESYLQASENVQQSSWSDRIKVIHADVRKFPPDRRYDLIICNPPFFRNHLKSPSSAERNKARHADDLSHEELIGIAIQLLNYPEGRLAVLLPEFNAAEMILLAAGVKLFPEATLTIVDRQGLPAISKALVFSFHGGKPVKDETLIIKNKQGNYTSDFISLLKDFYLHL